MPRYIDADVLKNLILNDMATAEREGKDLNGYTDSLFHLKTAPTADLAEVRHGYWGTDRFGMERSICSICGAVYEGDGGNYCPHCGAKMDAERITDDGRK